MEYVFIVVGIVILISFYTDYKYYEKNNEWPRAYRGADGITGFFIGFILLGLGILLIVF